MSCLTVNNIQKEQPKIFDLLKDEILKVNEIINEKTKSCINLIELVGNNLIQAGGKRIRPTLVLGTSNIFGTIKTSSIYLAASVEMIHTATLLHDDVIDNADLRRGNHTSNFIWGNTSSVLVGDYLFAKAFELMIHSHDISILNTLAQASSMVAQGEVHQLKKKNQIDLSFNEYLEIIGAKTASLFSASCEVGAASMNCHEEQRKICAQFGYNLGLAFQIVDDILDYRLDLQNSGKTLGNDLREGKLTLPVIIAIQMGIEIPFWNDIFNTNTNLDKESPEIFQKVYSILKKHRIFSLCQNHVNHYSNLALDCLKKLPKNNTNSAFSEFISYQKNRSQ